VQHRPLTLFWIAEFSDGSALAQFDPDTGKEVRAHPDWLPSKTDENGMIEKDGKKVPYREAYPIPEHFRNKTVKRLGWYPFNFDLARKVCSATGKAVLPTASESITINLSPDDRPVCYRSHEIKLHTRSGGVEYAETVYVLGVKGKRVLHIDENGEVID
jgi:hypothetical protein